MIIDVHDDIIKWSHDTNKTLDKMKWEQAYIDEMIKCWEKNHKEEQENEDA